MPTLQFWKEDSQLRLSIVETTHVLMLLLPPAWSMVEVTINKAHTAPRFPDEQLARDVLNLRIRLAMHLHARPLLWLTPRYCCPMTAFYPYLKSTKL